MKTYANQKPSRKTKDAHKRRLQRVVRAQMTIHADGTASFHVRVYDFRWADKPIAINGYMFAPVRPNEKGQPMSDKSQGILEHIEAAKKTSRPEQLLGQSSLAAPICSACRWWSKEPMRTEPPTTEHLCLRSKRTSFGAYGQDGKSIITAPTFGCNEYTPNDRAKQPL